MMYHWWDLKEVHSSPDVHVTSGLVQRVRGPQEGLSRGRRGRPCLASQALGSDVRRRKELTALSSDVMLAWLGAHTAFRAGGLGRLHLILATAL